MPGPGLENQIPIRTVVRFIDDLEIIQAKDHECAAGAIRMIAVQTGPDSLLELIFIEKTRNFVDLVLLPQADNRSRKQGRPASGVIGDTPPATDPAIFALMRLHPIFEIVLPGALVNKKTPHGRLVFLPIFRMDTGNPDLIEICQDLARQGKICCQIR